MSCWVQEVLQQLLALPQDKAKPASTNLEVSGGTLLFDLQSSKGADLNWCGYVQLSGLRVLALQCNQAVVLDQVGGVGWRGLFLSRWIRYSLTGLAFVAVV